MALHAVMSVWTQVCVAYRHGRPISQSTPCGVSRGLKITRWAIPVTLDWITRAASSHQQPRGPVATVLASGLGPEWDVESDTRSTGPVPGRWLSDVQNVRERTCVVIIMIHQSLSRGTLKSHNNIKRRAHRYSHIDSTNPPRGSSSSKMVSRPPH
jgi:hypothetical protein